MKVRLKDNTVRFRLTQTEVNDFATKGVIEARTHFGATLDSTLIYSLVKADCAALQASFNQDKIEIRVPEKLATVWVNTELVGLDNHGNTNESGLNILIEKDFACLKERVGEDESDMFPHPEEDTHNC